MTLSIFSWSLPAERISNLPLTGILVEAHLIVVKSSEKESSVMITADDKFLFTKSTNIFSWKATWL